MHRSKIYPKCKIQASDLVLVRMRSPWGLVSWSSLLRLLCSQGKSLFSSQSLNLQSVWTRAQGGKSWAHRAGWTQSPCSLSIILGKKGNADPQREALICPRDVGWPRLGHWWGIVWAGNVLCWGVRGTYLWRLQGVQEPSEVWGWDLGVMGFGVATLGLRLEWRFYPGDEN